MHSLTTSTTTRDPKQILSRTEGWLNEQEQPRERLRAVAQSLRENCEENSSNAMRMRFIYVYDGEKYNVAPIVLWENWVPVSLSPVCVETYPKRLTSKFLYRCRRLLSSLSSSSLSTSSQSSSGSSSSSIHNEGRYKYRYTYIRTVIGCYFWFSLHQSPKGYVCLLTSRLVLLKATLGWTEKIAGWLVGIRMNGFSP